MKFVHYDISTGKVLGYYTPELHSTIPEPNIEITDEAWKEAITNGYNYIDAKTGKMSKVDFRSLDEIKEAKINELKLKYNEDSQSNIVFTINGTDYEFQADEKSLKAINDVLTAVSATKTLPDGFYWVDVNNNKVPVTYDDLANLAQAILVRNFGLFDKLQALKEQVNNATSVDEVNSIVW